MDKTRSARLEAKLFAGVMRLPVRVQRALAGRRIVLDGQTLDTETQLMLRLLRIARRPVITTQPIGEIREAMLRQAALAGGRQPIGETRDLQVPGAAGPIGARLYTPRSTIEASGSPLLVFIHGGGMVYGGLDTHEATCRLLAERASSKVLAVDYRLAPEHRFPAAVEDCWSAYRWVVENVDSFGVDPERIAIGGDSAGGYLAAVTAIRAAEAGVPVKVQLLLYPVTNMADASESRRLFGNGFFLTSEFIEFANASYLPDGQDPRDPLVSVQFTEKIPDNLAPAFVVTAGFDPLRDEGEAYARLLADRGVGVELKRYPGFIHGFTNIVGVGRTNRAAVAEIAAKLKAAL
jgi:acetyl esterase